MENKLDEICKRLEAIEEHTQKMSTHIDFIHNIYLRYQSGLDFVHKMFTKNHQS